MIRHPTTPTLLPPEGCLRDVANEKLQLSQQNGVIPTKVAVRGFGPACSEIEVDANLNLTFWKSRCKTQRLAG